MKFSAVFHLVKRFATSVRPGPPSAEDEAWATSHLGAGERELWGRMNNPDRRHAVGVARAVVAELGPAAERAVVAAALLHDSGKVVSGYRTPARVAATVFWAVVDDRRAVDWTETASGRFGRTRQRLAQYRRHPELGSHLLTAAGADLLTIDWAREHHLPAEQWTVPMAIATVLKDCDDD